MNVRFVENVAYQINPFLGQATFVGGRASSHGFWDSFDRKLS